MAHACMHHRNHQPPHTTSTTTQVINHLIRKDNTLAVLTRPERNFGEADSDFLARVQAERVLTLNSNFAPDY